MTTFRAIHPFRAAVFAAALTVPVVGADAQSLSFEDLFVSYADASLSALEAVDVPFSPPISQLAIRCVDESESRLGIADLVAPPPAAFTPVCFGDGTGTACPCSNPSAVGAEEGCTNSLGSAGKLVASSSSGLASASADFAGTDPVVLQGSQMTSSWCKYFQGTTLMNGGTGVIFGDGLRCVGGSVIQLGLKLNVAGASQYPAAGDQSITVRSANYTPSQPISSGDTRHYQIWYRDAAPFCTAGTFNLTNAVSIAWGT